MIVFITTSIIVWKIKNDKGKFYHSKRIQFLFSNQNVIIFKTKTFRILNLRILINNEGKNKENICKKSIIIFIGKSKSTAKQAKLYRLSDRHHFFSFSISLHSFKFRWTCFFSHNNKIFNSINKPKDETVGCNSNNNNNQHGKQKQSNTEIRINSIFFCLLHIKTQEPSLLRENIHNFWVMKEKKLVKEKRKKRSMN